MKIAGLINELVEYYNKPPLSEGLNRKYLDAWGKFELESVEAAIMKYMSDSQHKRMPFITEITDYIRPQQLALPEPKIDMIDRQFNTALLSLMNFNNVSLISVNKTYSFSGSKLEGICPLPDPARELDAYLEKVKKWFVQFKSFDEEFVDKKLRILRNYYKDREVANV